MQTKKEKAIIMEIAAPPLKASGFELVYSDHNIYEFRNPSMRANVSMNRSPHGDYFRTEFSVKPYLLKFDDLKIDFPLTSDMYFNTDDEFLHNLQLSVSALVQYAIPLLERLSHFTFLLEDELRDKIYSELSTDTHTKAKYLANKIGLDIYYSEHNILKIQDYLETLRSNNYTQSHLLMNLDQIISTAAFIGESLRLSFDHVNWEWVEGEPFSYFILLRNAPKLLKEWSPSRAVIDHWLCTPETNLSLQDACDMFLR